MAATRSASVLVVLALLVISCCHCHASRDAPGDLKEEKEAVIRPMADPSCFLFKDQMCTVQSCTDYCLRIGLRSSDVGFCSFRVNVMQMYCCCPIPDPPPPARPT